MTFIVKMEGPLNLSKFIFGFITNAGLTTLHLINCMNMIMDENLEMISHFLSDLREKIGNLLQTFWRQNILKFVRLTINIQKIFKIVDIIVTHIPVCCMKLPASLWFISVRALMIKLMQRSSPPCVMRECEIMCKCHAISKANWLIFRAYSIKGALWLIRQIVNYGDCVIKY